MIKGQFNDRINKTSSQSECEASLSKHSLYTLLQAFDSNCFVRFTFHMVLRYKCLTYKCFFN